VFICGLLVLSIVIRVAALLLTPHALQDDTDGYWRLAENLVAYGTLGESGTGPFFGVKSHFANTPQAKNMDLSPSATPRPTAYRPPLYPLVLAPCVALGDYGRAAIGALHVLLGAATVGLVLLVGRWWGLKRRGAALAALLVACDPILLMWSTRVMTETLATFLAVAGLVALTWTSRRRSAHDGVSLLGTSSAAQLTYSKHCLSQAVAHGLAGAILGLGVLCRPTLLLWTIAAGVAFLLGRQLNCRPQPTTRGCGSATATPIRPNSRGLTAPESIFDRLRLPLAFALGALLVLSPWAIRNQLQFGRPIVTTTHGGYTLMLANNPEFYQWLHQGSWGSVWQADQFNADWSRCRPPGELQADRLAYHEAWQTIRREPGTFAYACLVRLGRFWSPLPHQVAADERPLGRLSRWAVAVWYAAEFFFGAIGLVCLSRGERREERDEENDECGMMNAELWPEEIDIHHSSFIIHHSAFWSLLLVGCLMAAHAVYWTDMRMRAPVMPLVALVAAAGISSVRKVTKKDVRTSPPPSNQQ
jgi:hypothetical protein